MPGRLGVLGRMHLQGRVRISLTDPLRDLFSRRGIGVGVLHLELTCDA